MFKMKNMTLQEKVVTLFGIFLIAVPGFCLFFSYRVVKAEVTKENLERMASYAAFFERGGKEGLAQAANFGFWPGRVTLINDEGVVLYDSSGSEAEAMDNHLQRPEIQEALATGKGTSLRYSATLRAHMHYYALKTLADGQPVFIRVAYPISAFAPILASFVRRSAVALVSVGGISLFFWVWLAKRLFKPLEEIVQLSRHVGTTGVRFPIFHDVELQRLSEALNTMSERLREADADIRSRREELARIIEALPIGVILMDSAHKVRYLNGVTRSFFGGAQDVIKGSPVERLIPNEEIYGMLDADTSGVVFLTPSANEGDGIIVEVATVGLATGRLMTLRDVTEERRLEETRRNFIIGASHELQTPLTAIRSAAELLAEEEAAESEEAKKLEESVESTNKLNKKSLLSIILHQQERMTSLIDGLLLLVKLSGSQGEPALAERTLEDLAELLETVAEEFRNNPATRPVVLDVKNVHGEAACLLRCNREELLRAFSNVVDNAVRKCKESKESKKEKEYGAIPSGRVRLSLRRAGLWAVVTVSDNGPGVSPEVAAQISKSFRMHTTPLFSSSGGLYLHGLGLSITDRIVKAHGGFIELLPPLPTGGAEFEIRLPIEDVSAK